MDGFYRGLETSLLVLSLALGIGAFAASALPRDRPPLMQAGPVRLAGGTSEILAVTLPILSVTADAPAR